jgi:FMN reductase
VADELAPPRALRIGVIVGNPKPQSRTLGVATAVADALAGGIGMPADRLVVDLAEYAPSLFDQDSDQMRDLNAAVAECDLLVVASPTFKATYTGMLKALFDRYGYRPLEGSVAVPVMTGAATVHALAVELHLRPLLVELGATVPTRGLYVTEAELSELETVVAQWASTELALVRQAVKTIYPK